MHIRASILLLFSLIAGGFPAACSGGGNAGTQAPTSPATPASSGYFPYQQGWLGADGAYSVPIGSGQSLWIFAAVVVTQTLPGK